MSSSKVSNQGHVVSMQDTFLQRKPKQGHTKLLTGPRVGHSRPTA